MIKAHVSIALQENSVKCMAARLNVRIAVLVVLMETVAPNNFKTAKFVQKKLIKMKKAQQVASNVLPH
jgi:hypothetical protein